jgi:hypothetical protein
MTTLAAKLWTPKMPIPSKFRRITSRELQGLLKHNGWQPVTIGLLFKDGAPSLVQIADVQYILEPPK